MNERQLQIENQNTSALESFLQTVKDTAADEEEAKALESAEEIRPKKWLRVLISIPIDSVIDVKSAIEKIEQVPGIEVDYGAN